MLTDFLEIERNNYYYSTIIDPSNNFFKKITTNILLFPSLKVIKNKQEENVLELQITNKIQNNFSNFVLRIYTSNIIYDKTTYPTMTFLYFDGTVEEFNEFAFIYENGDSSNWETGQEHRGFDMYSVLLATPYNKLISNIKTITVKNIANISYWSLNYQVQNYPTWYWVNPLKLENQHFISTYNVPDPFIIGNNNTGCYINIKKNETEKKLDTVFSQTLNKVARNQSENIELFRADKDTSSTPNLVPDCHDPGTCLNTYLVAPIKSTKYPEFEYYDYGTIKIKVPEMYNGNTCDKTSFFNLLYFSLSTDFEKDSKPDNVLPYWTVNAYQLEEIKNNDGFAYVFFANYDKVYQYYLENQKENTTTPAIIDRCGKKGFLLGNSKYLYIFRYRASTPDWKGSPDNAPCYETLIENKPVTTKELGEWCPILVGENINSFDDFLNSSPPI